MIEMETSLVAACQDFFGRKQGQGLQDFTREYHQLTDKDREELRIMLTNVGYKVKK